MGGIVSTYQLVLPATAAGARLLQVPNNDEVQESDLKAWSMVTELP